MRVGTMAVLTATLACSLACGKSREQQQAEDAARQAAEASQKAAEQMGSSAKDLAKGLEEVAKGLEATATGSGAMRTVEPVSFRELQVFLPDVTGWERGKPTGEKMTAPFPFSHTEVTYTKSDAEIRAKITDTGFQRMLVAPYLMFLTTGYEKETANGYEKATRVNGMPGWETWNSEARDGELNAVVGKRFLVQLEGRGIDDPKVLRDVAAKIDFARLATLKPVDRSQ
jgi:hypothetical protein